MVGVNLFSLLSQFLSGRRRLLSAVVCATKRPPSLPPVKHSPNLLISDGDCSVLEIVFSFNTAGGYGPLPPSSRRYLKQMIHSLDSSLLSRIFDITSSTKTRIAIFAHGNHHRDGKKYVLKHIDFTDSIAELCQFVDDATPLSWGSPFHCYELVLRKMRKVLSWTPGSRRVLVMFGSTPPHHGDHEDGEMLFWGVEARCLAHMDVTAYTVETLLETHHDFYRGLAEITDGCCIGLEQFSNVHDIITAIICNIVGPPCLDEFEEELMDREDNSLNTDILHMFAVLHQYNERVVAPPGECPGTPLGGDFGDEDYHDFVTLDTFSEKFHEHCRKEGSFSSTTASSASLQVTEDTHGRLTRQNSEFDAHGRLMRKKSERTQTTYATAKSAGLRPGQRSFHMGENKMGDFKSDRRLQKPEYARPVPCLRRESNSTVSARSGSSVQSRGGRNRMSKQQTVTFYLPSETDEIQTQQSETDPSGSPPTLNHVNPKLLLRKSRTVALPVQMNRENENKARRQSSQEAGNASNTELRPAKVRRGVTNIGFGGKMSAAETASEGLSSGGSSHQIYKIDKDTPSKREEIQPKSFTLRHLLWSPWILAISPWRPTEDKREWEKRSQARRSAGYRRLKLFDSDDSSTLPSLYEVALRAKGGVKKVVVYHKFLAETKENIDWENQVLEGKDIQEKVNEAVQEKSCVFIRRATFSQHTRRAQGVVKAALHKYDYAWNEVQGFKRPLRHVEL
ncbi:hypothetical protein BaRGS_00040138 [Batillaria attramentaria]|uniref:Uncharacterized protein n=1 Tax=Batillaria attramentaria TaxID=370345 RepID=A0ABD0J109_9CAEN